MRRKGARRSVAMIVVEKGELMVDLTKVVAALEVDV